MDKLAFDMDVDFRNAGAQAFLPGNKKNVCVVCREGLHIINRRKRASQCPILNQLGRHQAIGRSKYFGQWNV